jgi:hypothetical protein
MIRILSTRFAVSCGQIKRGTDSLSPVEKRQGPKVAVKTARFSLKSPNFRTPKFNVSKISRTIKISSFFTKNF